MRSAIHSYALQKSEIIDAFLHATPKNPLFLRKNTLRYAPNVDLLMYLLYDAVEERPSTSSCEDVMFRRRGMSSQVVSDCWIIVANDRAASYRTFQRWL